MPDHPNSFDARATLTRRRPRAHDLPPRRAAVDASTSRGCPSRSRSCSRTCCAPRNGSVDAADVEALASWDAKAEPDRGDRLHARARRHAGLHRRARRRRPRRDARRDGRPRRRPERRSTRSCPPSSSSTTPCRSTSSARRDAFTHQRRARVRAQPRALRVPALGPGRVRQLRGRAARHRASSTRSTSSTSRASSSSTTRSGHAYPDTLVGTDSHTTMINGLGVLGWGVGGIEAEAAMLGQPMSMLIPQVVGFRLDGELPEGATATDLVLTVTEMLRKKGVVGKFVEFFGPGVVAAAARRPRDDRQHEPGVRLDLRDLPDRRRDAALPRASRAAREERIALVEAYAKEQGLWHDEDAEEPTYSDTLELDLGDVEPSLAGPQAPAGPRAAARRQGRVPRRARRPRRAGRRPEIANGHDEAVAETFPASDPPADGSPGHEPTRASPPRRPRSPRAPSSPSARDTRGRRRRSTARRSSSTTATSSSRRSRAARTRRTRRSCSAPGCSRATRSRAA